MLGNVPAVCNGFLALGRVRRGKALTGQGPFFIDGAQVFIIEKGAFRPVQQRLPVLYILGQLAAEQIQTGGGFLCAEMAGDIDHHLRRAFNGKGTAVAAAFGAGDG